MTHARWFRALVATMVIILLTACGGGGNSSETHISGAGLNALGRSGPVVLPYAFTQGVNNMQVVVDSGLDAFSLQNANILYATVTVCEHLNTSHCVSVDHVQVDTGSVGLRLLSSALHGLNLPDTLTQAGTERTYECYPFVIGGLWGRSVLANVGLGPLSTSPIPIQVIDDASPRTDPIAPHSNCISNVSGQMLDNTAKLGSNGILGIGSTVIDCGLTCQSGAYGSFKQYWACGATETIVNNCVPAAVAETFQMKNPVSFITAGYNNGTKLVMPNVSGLGAGTATGELIFGVDILGHPNTSSAGLTRVNLGTTYPSWYYLNIATQYPASGTGSTNYPGYLDTGTNGLFFPDNSISLCTGSTWYCPPINLARTAALSDGGNIGNNLAMVNFDVISAETLFFTSNAAFIGLSGAASQPTDVTAPYSFAWGMPFFYGKKVIQTIWDTSIGSTPWYAWGAI